MAVWRRIKTAKKDGSPIWAYLNDSAIRLLRWETAEEYVRRAGYKYKTQEPEDFESAWVEVGDPNANWEPIWWLPIDAIPIPPAVR